MSAVSTISSMKVHWLAGQVVHGSDAVEDLIGDTDACGEGWHRGADVGKQLN